MKKKITIKSLHFKNEKIASLSKTTGGKEQELRATWKPGCFSILGYTCNSCIGETCNDSIKICTF
ncbi:hypothetical protein ACJD0Z_11250 [Flavobacteriaceae bacterium M23B6Z8]